MFVCLVNEKGYNVNGSCLHHNRLPHMRVNLTGGF